MVQQGSLTEQLTLQSAAVAVGNGIAIDCRKVSVGQYATLLLQVTGITTATITWEATLDGTNWVGIGAAPVGTGTLALTATADGIFRADVRGITKFRARISAWTSGTITVIGVLVAGV